MASLLLENIAWLACMDNQQTELKDTSVWIVDGVIKDIGDAAKWRQQADEVINLQGHIVTPGLINTHHHLFQTLTRNVPGTQDVSLFGWLKVLYPIWSRLTPEAIHVSTLTGMAELILSGCTTTSDHLYLYPNGVRLEDQIEAAQTIGMRFHAMRGSMSIGESKGGLPPDDLTEEEAAILKECQRLIEAWHDPGHGSMLHVGVAPCSPFSVSTDLMRESAELAREYSVRLHTHLAEDENDIAYSREQFGMRPGEYVESLGWTGEDVWHAHCVKLDDEELDLFAHSHTGIAHCPCSNMRLGSGIAPVRQMIDKQVRVGLGVDGSASNDSSHLLAEARQAMLLQRVKNGAQGLTAREALQLATRGGAQVLGRADIGSIEIGKAADLVAWNSNSLAMAGGLSDPLAALIFCQPPTVDWSIINGRVIVREGQLDSIDLVPLIEKHNRLSMQLLNGD